MPTAIRRKQEHARKVAKEAGLVAVHPEQVAKQNPGPKSGKTALKKLSKVQFEKLCQIQCTEEEISDWFGIEIGTLNRWCQRTYEGRTFEEVFEIKKGVGRVSLRRAQWRMAMKNVPMAIFLGKNILGQTDRQQVETIDKTAVVDEVKDIDPKKLSVEELRTVIGAMQKFQETHDSNAPAETGTGRARKAPEVPDESAAA